EQQRRRQDERRETRQEHAQQHVVSSSGIPSHFSPLNARSNGSRGSSNLRRVERGGANSCVARGRAGGHDGVRRWTGGAVDPPAGAVVGIGGERRRFSGG